MRCQSSNPHQVCWKCGATKGTHDVEMAYTNCADDAPWRDTIYTTLPWDEEPSLSKPPGFNLKMLGLDILHIFHLGTGRDLVASAIRVLARLRVWRGNNLDQQLASASVSMRSYAKQHRLPLRLKRLSKVNLNWRSHGYPEAHCKGYDTFVRLKWLEFEMDQGGRAEVPHLLRTVIWASNNVFGLLANAGMFLTPHQQELVQTVGNLLIRSYLQLASDSLDQGDRLWKIRPKFHLLHHLFLESGRPSALNFHHLSTWMGEDSVKRWMTIKRRTHRLQTTGRSLQRWLLGLRPKLEAIVAELWKKGLVNLSDPSFKHGIAFAFLSCLLAHINVLGSCSCKRVGNPSCGTRHFPYMSVALEPLI